MTRSCGRRAQSTVNEVRSSRTQPSARLPVPYDVLGCPAAPMPATCDRPMYPEMIVLIRRLIETGHAYPRPLAVKPAIFQRLLRRQLRRAGPASGSRHCAPAHPTPTATVPKRDPARLRAVEGPQAGRAGLGDAVGVLADLAGTLECLGDGHQVPGRDVRHSRRRAWTWSSRTTRTSSPSPCSAGDGFARYWLHNGLVRLGGEKMSKSTGNFLLVDRGAAKESRTAPPAAA